MEDSIIITQEVDGIDRYHEPVTFGFPFPKGMVREENTLTLMDEKNEVIPLQVAPLALWPDQSFKWVLLDFQASVYAHSISKYTLTQNAMFDNLQQGIKFSKKQDGWKIDTNKASFYLDTQIFRPFCRVVVEDVDIIDGSTASFIFTDEDSRAYEPNIKNIEMEIEGKLRTVIKIDGAFLKRSKEIAQFIARIHFFANHSFVKLDFTLRNPKAAKHSGGLWDLGDPGSILFQGLTLEIPLKSNSARRIEYSTESGTPLSKFSGSELVIYQDSSGGENWKSSNHVNHFGKVMHRFKGYEVRDREKVIDQGLRATPLIFIGDIHSGISGTVQQFWQNFPKALEAKVCGLKIRLFPHYYNDLHELQGGEQKTHTLFLDFSGRPDTLWWTRKPLLPTVQPEWYAKSETFPYLEVSSSSDNQICESLIESAITGKSSFFKKREIIDEYGWRNFGDIYADHEAIGYKGPPPLISHYNNQYDLIYSFIHQFIRTNSIAWYELFNDLAHHVIDIDIYRSSNDRTEFNGGFFWHTDHYLDAATSSHRTVSKEHLKNVDPQYCGGGPALEHNYTTGLMYYYFLSGNQQAKETVLLLADWVMNLTTLPDTLFGFLYEVKKKIPAWKTVLSRQKNRADKYPFSRSTGNSINTLLDAFSLSGERKYLNKVELLIKNCIHPTDDIESRNLLNAELSWSYTVCLQAIGRYLDIKVEYGEIDQIYAYAKQSLLHYANWMLNYEYPYLNKAELLEFPNETWPAQDLRKSCVLYFAAKHSQGTRKSALLQKAAFFYNYAINELNKFDTKTFTRPLALLMQNGYMHNYFQNHVQQTAPTLDLPEYFQNKQEFWTTIMVLKYCAKEFVKVLKHTSISREAHWLKCRRNSHI